MPTKGQKAIPATIWEPQTSLEEVIEGMVINNHFIPFADVELI